jgi:hypothetical protein
MANPLPPLLVKITREPGLESYTFTLPDGSTEDLEPEEALEWFRLRHVGRMDVDLIERALDDCWNFYSAEILVENPRIPRVELTRTSPNI